MSIDSVMRLKQTVIFQSLVEKEKATHTNEISEKLLATVRHVSPLLERVSVTMPEFTLHDPNHSAKVVELMSQIIPADTFSQLNVVELAILVYSAYLHDIGMTASIDEREDIIKNNPDYQRLLLGQEEILSDLKVAKEMGDHRKATFIEDKLFTEYLRRFHVVRSANFISRYYSNGEHAIEWQGTPYHKWVIAVCKSHELSVQMLCDLSQWPRDALVRSTRINVQYLSLVLRLADILDLDPERTPKSLLDHINFENQTSLVEWQKHRSVIGWEISPERIRFEAECTNPVYERALREFLTMIENERRDTVMLASSYRDELSQIYRFDLSEMVTSDKIRSNGEYIYSDLKFQIDYRKVMQLLMGERLYGNPYLALREIIQNSVDAIRYREVLEKKISRSYEPSIIIDLNGDELTIEDNGIGMDENIFANYFMQVGRSYYNSSEMKAQALTVDTVSEFGIGILSVFMIAEELEVESRRLPIDPLNPASPICIEIPTAYDYFVRRPCKRTNVGTRLKLKLKSPNPINAKNLIKQIKTLCPFVEYPIYVTVGGEKTTICPIQPGVFLEDQQIKRYLSISFDETPNIGITGKANIVNRGGHFDKSYLGVVAQRGFAIGYSDRESHGSKSSSIYKDLFPNWANIESSINLSGNAKLTLTSNRTDVIKDVRFETVRTFIHDHIISAYSAHLQEKKVGSVEEYAQYVDELLDTGALTAHSWIGFEMPEKLRSLFLGLVPLHCITGEGEFGFIYGTNLTKSSHFVVASMLDCPSDVNPREIRESLCDFGMEHLPILLRVEKGGFSRDNFINHIFGEPSNVLLARIAGVVFEIIPLDMKEPREFNIQGKMHFSPGFRSAGINVIPLFVHPPAPTYFQHVVFNANHPLIAPLLNGEKACSPEAENCLLNLEMAFDTVFLKQGKEIPTLWSESSNGSLSHSGEAPNKYFVSILQRKTNLIDEFRAIVDEYISSVVELGLLLNFRSC